MTRRIRLALTVTLALACAAPAFADEVTGDWTFRTGTYSAGTCTMNGRMTIKATPTPNVYDCAFVTFETCKSPENPHSSQVTQTCRATRTGTQLVISSKIKKIERQSPHPYAYAPDSWALAIAGANKMTGSLVSAQAAWALFERKEVPVS